MALETPTWLQNGEYSARMDRSILHAGWTEGVRGLSKLRVYADGLDMSVYITAGDGVVEGDDEPFQGAYLIRSTAIENRTLAAAPGANSRYDLVIARVDDSTANGVGDDEWDIEVITGTAAGTPVVPTLPPTAIPLAVVGPITPSTLAIDDSLIDDVRPLAGRWAPAGTVELYTGTRPPTNWVWADGAAHPRTGAPVNLALEYDAQGFPYGPGDGVTTFNVPNLGGRTPLAVGGPVAGAVGATGGATTVTLTAAEMPVHTHVQNAHTHTQNSHNHSQSSHTHSQNSHSHSTSNHSHTINHGHSASTNNTGSHSHNFTADTGSGFSYNFMPPGLSFSALGGVTRLQLETGSTGWYLYAGMGMNNNGAHSHTVTVANHSGNSGNAAPSTNSTTATNNSTTATNNAETATNQNTTATNQNAGGGEAHNNLPPYLLTPGWIVSLG